MNTIPRDEEVIKKLKAYQNDETISERYQKRFQILLLLMEGKTDEEVCSILGTAKATVNNTRQKYLAEGLKGLYDPDKPKAAQTYEKTYECNLGFMGPDPSLQALYISDDLMLAAIRMEGPLVYDNQGLGTIFVKGKPMTQKLDALTEDGKPLSIFDALQAHRSQTFKSRYFSGSSELIDFLEDYKAHHGLQSGRTLLLIGDYMQSDYDYLPSYDRPYAKLFKNLFPRYNLTPEYLDPGEWFVRLQELLSHQSPQGDQSLKELLDAISDYSMERKEESLPFIWHASPAKAMEAKEKEDPTHMAQEVSAEDKLINGGFKMQVPVLKPGEGALVLAAFLFTPGEGTQVHLDSTSVTGSFPLSLEKMGGEGNLTDMLSDADSYSSRVRGAYQNLSQGLDSKLGTIALKRALDKMGAPVIIKK